MEKQCTASHFLTSIRELYKNQQKMLLASSI